MRPHLILGALLVAGALNPLHAAAAAAPEDCTNGLDQDSEVILADTTALWDLDESGAVADGQLLGSGRNDAYDDFEVFAIDDGTNGLEDYDNDVDTCTFELDGRQVAYPVMTTTGGLELSRKVYVPASGPSFARFYNQVHNPGATPATITLYTTNGNFGDLGSDVDTQIDDSSAGAGIAFVGNQLDTAVTWFSTSDGAAGTDPDADPTLAHNLDDNVARVVKDRVDEVVYEPTESANLSFVYENVTIPAGGTVAYVAFDAMRATVAEAGAAARYVDGHPAALFAGLTPAERAAVQNWVATDADGDGVPDATDNCPTVPNPDQTNTDGGASGDVCDSDADNDGIPNDVEIAFGTNPLKADTDGDNVRDNVDNCPKVAGGGADGCPPATVVVNNARRASTTTLKVTETKTGPVTIKTKGHVKGSGTPTALDCTHGLASVVVKVGGLAVSHRIVKLKATCTFKSKVTLDQPRRLVKKVKVTGQFLGSDALLPSKKTVKL